jgi:cytochrome c553
VRTIVAILFVVPALAQTVDFVSTVHPILAQRCAGCHSGANPKGGLSVTSREGMLKAIVPGKSSESLLIKRVTGKIGPAMPLEGPKLTDAEIKTLSDWIDQNAPWTNTEAKTPEEFSPALAPRRPTVPESKYPNPIDRFLDAYFQSKNLPFGEPVSDNLFARRAWMDLWGVVPSATEVDAFLKDSNPDKRVKLIDRLLADSTMYTGHWISFWNDLLRNDQGVNYAGTRKSITPWLQSALRGNLPYDKMVVALLNPAKDVGPEGFLLGVNWRGAVNASQTPFMQASQNTAQVFLGVNLKCASCHDSFINRYKLKQSYGMAALFSDQSQLELVRCDVKTGKFTGPEFLFPQIGTVPENASPSERRAAAARLFTSPENGRLARTIVNRIWGRFFDYGLVEPVDEMDNQPWNLDLLDWLAADFADQGYDLKHLMRRIMTSRAYQLPSIPGQDEKGKEYTFRGPRPRRLTAEQFVDAVSSLTGEWRVLQSDQRAVYVREWELKSTPLSRALGRPIRDQVYTTRNSEATTLQGLELVNGDTLGAMLRRGSRRILGQLPAAPAPLYDSKTLRKGNRDLDVDLTGVKALWLLLTDAGSYDPSRTVAGWADVALTGPRGDKKLSELVTLSKVQTKGLTSSKKRFDEVVTPGVSSTLFYDIDGLGFTRMRGHSVVDDESVRDDINPAVRFFVFTTDPDRHQLMAVTGDPPAPALRFDSDPRALIDDLFLRALCRKPNAEEAEIARHILAPNGKASVSGLEDLLWSLLMHPEMQYVY